MADNLPAKLTNADYVNIVKATNEGTVIEVQGQKFDGTGEINPKDIAALYDRIDKPDVRSLVLAHQVKELTADNAKTVLGNINRIANGGAIKPTDFPVKTADDMVECFKASGSSLSMGESGSFCAPASVPNNQGPRQR